MIVAFEINFQKLFLISVLSVGPYLCRVCSVLWWHKAAGPVLAMQTNETFSGDYDTVTSSGRPDCLNGPDKSTGQIFSAGPAEPDRMDRNLSPSLQSSLCLAPHPVYACHEPIKGICGPGYRLAAYRVENYFRFSIPQRTCPYFIPGA